jgi:hypothetical protein
VLIVNGKVDVTAGTLFGKPVAVDLLPYVAIPTLGLSLAGLVAGFYFGHRWKLGKLGIAQKVKNLTKK